MSKRVIITSGGTGGHIIPARCLAQELINHGDEVIFLGDVKYRSYIRAEDKFESKIISSAQIVRSPIALAKSLVKIAFGTLKVLTILCCFRPQYVVAFGGYTTFPTLIATILTRPFFNIKIVLHEQNYHLGKVHRIFAKYAHKIALSFAETSGIEQFLQEKTIFTGNPVRPEILKLNESNYQLPDENLNVLVLGGSGGAEIFSKVLPEAFLKLRQNSDVKMNIFQQCRKELVASTAQSYSNSQINITINHFFENMAELIAKSHLVIARAGSSSIFEFTAAKKPMILVPFAKSANDHQQKNAEFLSKNGAAILIKENEFTAEKICDTISELLSNKEKLKTLSNNSAQLAAVNACKNLAQIIS